ITIDGKLLRDISLVAWSKYELRPRQLLFLNMAADLFGGVVNRGGHHDQPTVDCPTFIGIFQRRFFGDAESAPRTPEIKQDPSAPTTSQAEWLVVEGFGVQVRNDLPDLESWRIRYRW